MISVQNSFHPPYGALQQVLAFMTLALGLIAAVGTFFYGALIFGTKGVFNPNTSTEVHINMLDGKVFEDSTAKSLHIPGNPGGYADPSTTWMLYGEEPLSQTISYKAIAEAGHIALMAMIILLLVIGSILVLANRSIAPVARFGVLALGILAVIVSVLVPFFQREASQATLRELGIEVDADQLVIVTDYFDYTNINFLMMGLGLVLMIVALLIPRHHQNQPVGSA